MVVSMVSLPEEQAVCAKYSIKGMTLFTTCDSKFPEAKGIQVDP